METTVHVLSYVSCLSRQPGISQKRGLTSIGLPKGVMLTHQNVIINLLQTDPVTTDLRHDGGVDGKGDVVIAVLPFYHVYGEIQLISLKYPF